MLVLGYCTHCMVNDAVIVVVFLVYDGQRIHRQNKSDVLICLRKSDSSQRLSVMRLYMGTINSFCLDDGVRKISNISNLCISATKLMKILY